MTWRHGDRAQGSGAAHDVGIRPGRAPQITYVGLQHLNGLTSLILLGLSSTQVRGRCLALANAALFNSVVGFVAQVKEF
jgi:hypothetical protein